MQKATLNLAQTIVGAASCRLQTYKLTWAYEIIADHNEREDLS
jgi:hypothetical protein